MWPERNLRRPKLFRTGCVVAADVESTQGGQFDVGVFAGAGGAKRSHCALCCRVFVFVCGSWGAGITRATSFSVFFFVCAQS